MVLMAFVAVENGLELGAVSEANRFTSSEVHEKVYYLY